MFKSLFSDHLLNDWLESWEQLNYPLAPLEERPRRSASEVNLEFEIPGVKRDQIVVRFRGPQLHIEYTTRNGTFRSHKYLVSEALYDRKKIECKYEDGLLTVKVPLLKPSKEGNLEQEVKVEIK